MTPIVYPHWQDTVVFSADGPKPQILLDSVQFKVVLVGLEAGQKIPRHPAAGAVYQVLDGRGWMLVGDKRIAVEPGVIVVVPEGAPRGFEATTRLAFIGSRGADA
jgi:quercetin dioxygenase-like cupin family protein